MNLIDGDYGLFNNKLYLPSSKYLVAVGKYIKKSLEINATESHHPRYQHTPVD